MVVETVLRQLPRLKALRRELTLQKTAHLVLEFLFGGEGVFVMPTDNVREKHTRSHFGSL